jgi:DnaJ-class molecular chaperone
LANATPAERKQATEKFQAVADAYYVLSDPERRREYDVLYRSRPSSDRTNDPNSSSSFFDQFASMFGSSGPSTSANANTQSDRAPRPDAEGVFTDVFEEVPSAVFFY